MFHSWAELVLSQKLPFLQRPRKQYQDSACLDFLFVAVGLKLVSSSLFENQILLVLTRVISYIVTPDGCVVFKVYREYEQMGVLP